MDMNLRSWKDSQALRALWLGHFLALIPTCSPAAVASKSSEIDVASEVGALAFSPDGNYLAIDHSGNGGTDIFDLQHKSFRAHLAVGGLQIRATDMMHFSPNGHQLAICGIGPDELNIHIYDTSTWKLVHSIPNGLLNGIDTGNGCQGLLFTPDGKGLVRLTNQVPDQAAYNLIFYDTSTWDVTSAIRTMPLASNGKPWVPNTPLGIALRAPDDPTFNFYGEGGTLAFTKNGRFLALGGRSLSTKQWHPGDGFVPATHQLVVIDLSTRTLSRVIPAHVESLDWSPDGGYIAAGLSDEAFTIKIFNAYTGAVLASEEHGPALTLVRFTPDGKYLIQKVGKQVQIWEAPHDRLVQTIHAAPECLAVSHDGHFLALGGAPPSMLDATPLLSLITHPNGPKGKVLVYALK
jgi:WD40 repeat protein